MSDYLDFLSGYFENSFKSYALFDKDFNLIKGNTDLFSNGLLLENLVVYDKNGRETDFYLAGEKYGIIKQGRKLTAVTVTPVYYGDELYGYSVVLLAPYELFGGELVSRKTSGDVRHHVSAIIANTSVLKDSLEAAELYDQCIYTDDAFSNCMKLLSAITNSEMITAMFENRERNAVCDVSTIMNELIQVVKFSFSTNMTITEEIEANLYADIDKEQFVSVVMNLIVNSYLYNLSDEKKVFISLKRINENIVVTVDDNGSGIDESYLKDFIPTKKPVLLGKEGLGLAVAKLFARVHNGDMNIISKGEGIGTTVRVSVPACEPDQSFTMSNARDYIKNRFSTLYVVLAKAGLKD